MNKMIIKAEISQTGRSLTLYSESSGQLIAEIIVHGFLARAMEMSEQIGTYVYRGEMFQLAGYEYLDKENEVITERDN